MRFPKTPLESPLAPKASEPQRHIRSNTTNDRSSSSSCPVYLQMPGECQGTPCPTLLGQHVALSLRTLEPPGIKRKESVPSKVQISPTRHPTTYSSIAFVLKSSLGCFYCLASCGRQGHGIPADRGAKRISWTSFHQLRKE